MPRQNSDASSQAIQRQQALSRWDNEGGAGPVPPWLPRRTKNKFQLRK